MVQEQVEKSDFYTLTHIAGMVLYSWAKRLCRISCVESAMRLPVLGVGCGGGGEVGKEGEEKQKQAVLPTVVSGGHCGRCMHVAHHFRLKNKTVWPG